MNINLSDSNKRDIMQGGNDDAVPLSFPVWPHYGEDEVEAVARVMRSGKVNNWTGDDVQVFERALEAFSGHRHAIAVANGTVALELALKSLDIGAGDEVICTPRSFVASASCVLSVGAKPVFADLDLNSQNLTAASIGVCLTPKTKAVILVHLAGWPCDMAEIMDLCNAAGVPVIEDCAQAHGAKYQTKSVGSFGKISTWSFCQDKIISTGGEGGCVTTSDANLYELLWTGKEHGKSFRRIRNGDIRERPIGYNWIHDSLGTNARMTGIQAAIGVIQLAKLDSWHAQRKANADFLWSSCAGIPGLRVPELQSNVEHAYYLGYVFVEPTKLKNGWSRDRIVREILGRSVPVSVGSCPELYREAVFKDFYDPSFRLPVAQELGETSMAFPIHPSLEDHHMERLCMVVEETMQHAVR